ncbi:MAG: GNAT family N-acetyltransferase [Gammaproteobacteria bacterium]|nr:GNAT family N-acetyltransferase [Gammaproteobacteria bacterium]
MSNIMQDDYPQAHTLPDNTTIELRAMSAADKDAVLKFAQQLPQEDLLFLSMDLTEPNVVDEWIANITTGRSLSLVAYDADKLIGYASVHRNRTPWMRRVGEIRVNVGPSFRARGLGRILVSRIFDIARAHQLKKLIAQMTTDQHGAQGVFRKLGFVPEAVLADFVEDRNGTTRDLVMMTFDVDGLTDQAGSAIRVD